ncbi:hypothetical protein F5146DRAFT_1200423 [Armillaria mellea]|nr:hypothetical protein F5146DRAFT_1200423 [Armillaria mellea]
MVFSTGPVRPTTSLPSVCRGLSPPRSTSAYPTYEESQRIAAPRSQDQLKQLMVEELADAVFESPLLLERVWSSFHRSTHIKNWAKQRDHVMKHIFTEQRVVAVSESKAYKPLAKTLNDILRNAPAPAGHDNDPFFEHIRFIVYDKPMLDQVDGAYGLKPDLICAILSNVSGNTWKFPGSATWKDLEHAGEVKARWLEMLMQGATYGRALLRCGRWYSVTICYHFQKDVRFCFFTTQGMFLTPAFSLANKSDFQQIVDGLFAFRNLSPYERGLHPLFIVNPTKYVLLPRDMRGSAAWWKITRVLCIRTSIRGCRSMVAVIEAFDTRRTAQETSPSPILPGATTMRSLPNTHVSPEGLPIDKSNPPSDRRLRPRKPPVKADFEHPTPSTCQASGSDIPLRPLPSAAEWLDYISRRGVPNQPLLMFFVKHAVIKMGYCLEEDSEVQRLIFKNTAGQHGIPDILPVIKLQHSLNVFRDLPCGECPDAGSVYSGQRVQVEDRVEIITIFLDKGRSLIDSDMANSEWVKCLMDGIIGYLRRDISIGNVLRRREPQNRETLQDKNSPLLQTQDFAFLKEFLVSCSGFLIDSDMDIRWRGGRYAQTILQRSGTPQFLSRRLLHAWENKTWALHTMFDDLESFAWLGLESQRTGIRRIQLR